MDFGGLVWLLIVVGIIEIIGRCLNHPFRPPVAEDVDTHFRHIPDPKAGWTLVPGQYAATYRPAGFPHRTIRLTIGAGGDRLTSDSMPGALPEHRPLISIYGCSFTFGWSLDDSETFCWMLQDRLSEFRIKNYGVSGYSTYQQLLRMEETVDRDRPKAVVLGFGDWQARRNVNEFNWIRELTLSNMKDPASFIGNPFCRVENGNLTRHPPERYHAFPYSSRSSFLSLLEWLTNKIRFRCRSIHAKVVTQMLLMEIRKLCERRGIVLLIFDFNFRGSSCFEAFCRLNGFHYVKCDHVQNKMDRGNYPYSGHPNKKMNMLFASCLERYLPQILIGRHSLEATAAGSVEYEQEKEAHEDRFIYPLY